MKSESLVQTVENMKYARTRARVVAPDFSRLADVSWDFPDRKRASDLEAIHPYPAKFIPELPGTILDRVSVKCGTAVLDPFVGSGTTLVECQSRGIPSVGIDLNPIACLIARVKTGPLPPKFDVSLEAALRKAMSVRRPNIPEIPNLDHWFEAEVQFEIARIATAIEQAPKSAQDIFRLALSSILVRISNQDSDTRYAAVKKQFDPAQVPTFFATACRRIEVALKARNYARMAANVIEADTLAVKAKDIKQQIGAVITSPPYPNAYEYWLYHKYRMYWLGHDPIEVKDREIGARAHFFKTNHHTAENFAEQMTKTFALINDVLIPEGYVCFVVGRSKIRGVIVDNAKIVEESGASFGFRTVYKAERVIAANRKSFNLSHANIKTETVLILVR